MSILAIGANSKKAKVYSSARAASRELSGNGTDNRRSQIVRMAATGGYIGSVWVQDTSLRGVRSPR